MKPQPNRFRQLWGLALGAAIALGNLPGAYAQAQLGAAASPATQQPTPAQYALGLLKRSTDKLSGATNFTFKTASSVEVLSPVGQLINYFSTAEVAVQRPNKLPARKTGDGPSFDLCSDGKTCEAIGATLGLYADMA